MRTSWLASVDAENSGELLLLYDGTITQTEAFHAKYSSIYISVLFDDFTNSFLVLAYLSCKQT